MNQYKVLANAVIVQAATDYRAARRALKKCALKAEYTKNISRAELAKLETKMRTCRRMIRDVERFFRSSWFTMLSDADGRQILTELQKEVIR